MQEKIIKIIGEHKHGYGAWIFNRGVWDRRSIPPAKGYKRVEVVVEKDGRKFTRHLDILKK